MNGSDRNIIYALREIHLLLANAPKLLADKSQMYSKQLELGIDRLVELANKDLK